MSLEGKPKPLAVACKVTDCFFDFRFLTGRESHGGRMESRGRFGLMAVKANSLGAAGHQGHTAVAAASAQVILALPFI